MHHSTMHIEVNPSLLLWGQQWMPKGPPGAIVAIVHGYDEHSSRYNHVADYFVGKNIGVVSCDLRGHGRSPGKRVFVRSFDEYVDDATALFTWIRREYPDVTIFWYGHSMGAAVSVLFCLEHQNVLAGLITTGGAFMPGDDISPLLIKVSRVMGRILPMLPTIALDADGLSRDKAVVDAYNEDPLVSRKPFYARVGAEMMRAFATIEQRASELQLPLLIMHGTKDRLVNPEGSYMLYEKAGSKDKTLKMYDGWYHELVNEPEKQLVLDEMAEWIAARLHGKTKQSPAK